jgi:hypothetical protein
VISLKGWPAGQVVIGMVAAVAGSGAPPGHCTMASASLNGSPRMTGITVLQLRQYGAPAALDEVDGGD